MKCCNSYAYNFGLMFGLAVLALTQTQVYCQEAKPPAPTSWEFKAVSFGKHEGQNTKKLNELAADGWRYVGPLGNGKVAFKRRSKQLQEEATIPPRAITVRFTGHITKLDDRHKLFDDSIKPGTKFSGYYTFDRSKTGKGQGKAVGQYRHKTAGYGILIKAGNYTFKTNPRFVNFLIELHANPPPKNDTYLLRSYNNVVYGPRLPEPCVDHIMWQLTDTRSRALASSALLPKSPNLPSWNRTTMTIDGGVSRNKNFFIRGIIDGIGEAQSTALQFLLKDHAAAITRVMVTSDGVALFALDRKGDLHWWKIATGEKHTLQLSGPQWLALSPDAKYVMSHNQLMETNYYWNSDKQWYSPSTVSFLPGQRRPITSAAFSGDGKLLVTATGQRPGEVRIRNVSTFNERLPRVDYTPATLFPKGDKGDLLKLPPKLRASPGVERLALSAKGNMLATVYISTRLIEFGSGVAKVWDTKTGKAIGHVPTPGWSIQSLVFAPGGKTLSLALGKKNQGEVWMWDIAARKAERILQRPSAAQAVAYSPKGKLLAVGYADGFVAIWDLAQKEVIRLQQILPDAVNDLAFTPDGQAVVAGGGGERGWIRIWNLEP